MENLSLDSLVPVVSSFVLKVVSVIAILFGAWIIAGWIRRVVKRQFDRREFDATLSRFILGIFRPLLLTLAAISCLGLFGVETTSFAAVIGAVGLAIGLAFQGTLSNLAAGVMLLIFRPFKVGDFVDTGGETGTVNEIELFFTKLDTPQNVRVILPNSTVFGSVIKNFSFNAYRRVDVAVGTDYGEDLRKVRDVLERTAKAIPHQAPDTEPMVFLAELGGSSINWQVRVWTAQATYWEVFQETTRAVKAALDEAGIGIPFPQMDVHLETLNDKR